VRPDNSGLRIVPDSSLKACKILLRTSKRIRLRSVDWLVQHRSKPSQPSLVGQPQRVASPESVVGVFLAVTWHHAQPDVWHAPVTVLVGLRLRVHPALHASSKTEHRQ